MNIQPLSLEEYALSELHVKDLLNRRYFVFDCEGTGLEIKEIISTQFFNRFL